MMVAKTNYDCKYIITIDGVSIIAKNMMISCNAVSLLVLGVIKRQWQWQRKWQRKWLRQWQRWSWFRGRQYLLLCSVSPLGVIKRRPPPSLGSVKIGEVGVACSWWGGGPGWWGCCIPHIWHFTHPLHYLGVYTDNCMISRQNSQSWLK